MPAWSSCSSSRTTRRTRCEEQVVSVWAGTEGKLDDIPVGEVRRFETEFLQYLRHTHEGVLAAIAEQQVERRHRRPRWTRRSPSSSRSSSARTDEPSGQRRAGRGAGRGRARPARRSRASRRRRRREAVELIMAGPGTRPSSADPLGEVDEEDHQGDGARRDEPHRQGPGPGGGVPAVRRRRSPACSRRWRRNANIDHPLLTPRERVRRAGVLLVTSDRGLAGGYNSNAIRTAEQLIARLRGRRQGGGALRRRAQGRRRTTGSATGRSRPAGPASRSSRRSPTPARSARR